MQSLPVQLNVPFLPLILTGGINAVCLFQFTIESMCSLLEVYFFPAFKYKEISSQVIISVLLVIQIYIIP